VITPVHTSARYAITEGGEVYAIHAWWVAGPGSGAAAWASPVTEHPEAGTLYGEPGWLPVAAILSLAPNLGRARTIAAGAA